MAKNSKTPGVRKYRFSHGGKAAHARSTVPIRTIIQAPKAEELKQSTPSKLKTALRKNTKIGNEAKQILDALPELNLIRDILPATILNPRDLVFDDVNVVLKNIPLEHENLKAIQKLLKTEIIDRHNVTAKIEEQITECLFDYGSYSLMTLPTNVIDNIVDKYVTSVANENFRGSYSEALEGAINSVDIKSSNSILKHKSKKESKADEATVYSRISLTDNPNEISTSLVKKAAQQLKETEVITAGNESNNYTMLAIDDKKIIIDARRNTKNQNASPSITMKIPFDSIIPVRSKLDNEPVAFFIALDNGVPISRVRDVRSVDKLYEKSEKMLKAGNDVDRRVAEELKTSFGISNIEDGEITKENLREAFIDKIEEEIKYAMSSQRHGDSIEVSRQADVYEIMMARAFNNMNTRLLYVSSTFVKYMAYDLNEYGVGVSLIEQTKLIANLRILLRMARVQTSVTNSANGTLVTITLDNDDPDPHKTVNDIMQEIAILSSGQYPLGSFRIDDIYEKIAKAGIRFQIDGHEGYPTAKVDTESVSQDKVVPDESLDEILKREHYIGMIVPPELVDAALESDFAEGWTTNNKYFARRILKRQQKTERFWTNWIRDYIVLDGLVRNQIIDILNSDKNKVTITDLIETIQVKLPRHDALSTELKSEDIEGKQQYYEKIVLLFINEESFSDINVDDDSLKDMVDATVKATTNLLMRRWLLDQDMATEVFDLFENKDITLPESINSHMQDLRKILFDINKNQLKENTKLGRAMQKLMDRIEEDEEEDQVEGDVVDETVEESEEPIDDSETGDSDDISEGDTDFDEIDV